MLGIVACLPDPIDAVKATAAGLEMRLTGREWDSVSACHAYFDKSSGPDVAGDCDYGVGVDCHLGCGVESHRDVEMRTAQPARLVHLHRDLQHGWHSADHLPVMVPAGLQRGAVGTAGSQSRSLAGDGPRRATTAAHSRRSRFSSCRCRFRSEAFVETKFRRPGHSLLAATPVARRNTLSI